MELGPMSTPRRFWPRSIGMPSILILLWSRPLPMRVSSLTDLYVSYLTFVSQGSLHTEYRLSRSLMQGMTKAPEGCSEDLWHFCYPLVGHHHHPNVTKPTLRNCTARWQP